MRWIGIGLSLAFLAGLFFFVGPQLRASEIVDALKTIAPWSLAVAIAIFWSNFAISTERYRLILHNMNISAPGFDVLFRLTIFSMFAAHLVPAGPTADIVRAGFGRLKMGLPMVTAIQSVVYDRVLALVGLAVLGLMMLPVQIVRGVPVVLWAPQLVLWLASLLGILFVVWGGRISRIQRIPFLATLGQLSSDFVPVALNPKTGIKQTLLALAYCTTYGLVIWAIACGMGHPVRVMDVLEFSPLIFLVQSAPIFYLGWGARETVLVGTLGLIGALSKEQALAVSITVGMVFFLAATPGAIVWLSASPKAPKSTDSV